MIVAQGEDPLALLHKDGGTTTGGRAQQLLLLGPVMGVKKCLIRLADSVGII